MELLEQLLLRSPEATLVIRGDRFVDCNQVAADLLGCGRDEVQSLHPSRLSPPTQPDGAPSAARADEMIATAVAAGSHAFDWVHLRADGTPLPVRVLLTVVDRGEPATLHVVWRDLSELHLLQDRLQQARRLETVGRLVGGVAHDFNNLLSAILGNAAILGELCEDPAASDLLDDIGAAGRRASELVRQILSMGRSGGGEPVLVDLSDVVVGARRLLERVVGPRVGLVVELHSDPLPVRVGRSQLERALLNLATNGRDAMPDGGTLTVRTSAGPAGARVTVSDVGAGMAPEVLAHALDPYFTTKGVDGTGLGLTAVSDVVRDCGGAVSVDSRPGEGTAVHVDLPLAERGLPTARGASGAGPR